MIDHELKVVVETVRQAKKLLEGHQDTAKDLGPHVPGFRGLARAM